MNLSVSDFINLAIHVRSEGDDRLLEVITERIGDDIHTLHRNIVHAFTTGERDVFGYTHSSSRSTPIIAEDLRDIVENKKRRFSTGEFLDDFIYSIFKEVYHGSERLSYTYTLDNLEKEVSFDLLESGGMPYHNVSKNEILTWMQNKKAKYNEFSTLSGGEMGHVAGIIADNINEFGINSEKETSRMIPAIDKTPMRELINNSLRTLDNKGEQHYREIAQEIVNNAIIEYINKAIG